MNIFSNLTTEEIELVKEAPALVTILIGAADGKLDGEERNWSERLLRTRSYSADPELQDYYGQVSEGFWAELQHELSTLPADTAERNQAISNRLEKLNPVFAKLDNSIAYSLYKGLLGLAEETAKASGGFLRIGSIAAVEHEWVKLPMLTVITEPEKL